MSELPAAREFLAFYTRPSHRLLCAVSGGLDSMCLLHLLARWGPENRRRICAAHFNHHMRGEASDRDEQFVRDWCQAHGIAFFSGGGDVRTFARAQGLSIEEAARRLRYEFLRRTAEREGCKAILTAHHADDNAETILLNLVRGAGVTGLCGIPHERQGVLRPFLQVTRQSLAEYAAAHGLPHVEDETNQNPDAAARNLLRLQVMPLLKQLNPKAVEHMGTTARQLRTVDKSLEADARRRTAHVEVQKGRVTLSRHALEEAAPAVRPRMLLRLFDLLGAGRKDVSAVHLSSIWDLTCHASGKERRLNLPNGVTARYTRGWLILETRPQTLTEVELRPNQPLRWGEYVLTLLGHPEGEGLALRPRAEHESRTITVAPCPPGERLALPGSSGSRSIKRLCLDKRICLTERDGLPAIYAGERLAAVWRLGVDTEFLPETDECRFIQVIKETEEKQI